MMAENFLKVRGSSDTADLDSRALGLEAAVVDDITSAGEMSAAMVERPLEPQLPPKKAHLDEVFRLMKELDEIREEKRQGEEITDMMAQELDEIREEKRQAEEITDMMAQDLDIAQEEVQKKGDELRRKEAELLKCEEELKDWRQKAQSLSIEVQEEKRLAAEIKQSTEMQEAIVTSKTENKSQKEEELLRLRDQVAGLTASIATKEAEKEEAGLQNEKELTGLSKQVEQLTASLPENESRMRAAYSQAARAAYDKWQAIMRDKQLEFETKFKEIEERMSAQLTQEQDLRRVAEATLHDMREKSSTNSSQEQELRGVAEASLRSTKEGFEAKLREANERADIQIAELQKRAQEAESSLQEHTSRMEVEMDQENLLKRIHSLEAEVQDQRKACGWFKKNSERLSREIKETQASRTVLEQSEYAVKRQLAELKSQVTALQQRPRVQQMPGSY